MVRVVENTAGKTRDLPIDSRLKQILSFAGSVAGIDEVRIESGGQCAIGTCSKRYGSTRHDLGNAADLDLIKDGRVLKFTDSNDLPLFETFVEAAASFGATGIGGDIPYMGATRIHVGFGSRATWGGVKGSGAAPSWLTNAATKGWNNPLPFPNPPNGSSLFKVNARDGLNLRSGPSLDFIVIRTLPAGTIVRIQNFDGTNQEWAQVDLEGDGVSDGYVFRSFLNPVQNPSGLRIRTSTAQSNIEEGEEDCAMDNPQDDME
ncbi:MAG: SH3 domain-containing protein [Leptolyngbyaceae cyanobacterium SU_3_3]|nr:SH3 domain-containing protein [Leptolyngbyaceae cyanobacterium SU_3_3]